MAVRGVAVDAMRERDALAARLAEVEKERDEAFAKVDALYERIESHPDFKSRVEWMERAVAAEHERDEARQECERLKVRIAEIAKDASEAKRKLDKVRREDLRRETHSWLKANSAVNDILHACGVSVIDRPDAIATATTPNRGKDE